MTRFENRQLEFPFYNADYANVECYLESDSNNIVADNMRLSYWTNDFCWADTPEGSVYWHKVTESLICLEGIGYIHLDCRTKRKISSQMPSCSIADSFSWDGTFTHLDFFKSTGEAHYYWLEVCNKLSQIEIALSWPEKLQKIREFSV